jgi:hypothetical protein
MQTPRPIQGYQVVPLVGEIVAYIEAQSPVRVWEPLHTIARSPSAAAEHFSSIQDPTMRTLLVDEFSSYIRQAFDYFQGGTQVPGPSAALLYYYSALQLAKAELLPVDPQSILGVRIGHGLSHQISKADDPAQDFLTVKNGVFPELYKKRTGVAIQNETKIYIRDLLPYIPELGDELTDVLGAQPHGIPVYYALAHHGGEMFSLLLAGIDRHTDRQHIGAFERAIEEAFEEIPLNFQWKDIFGISKRTFHSPLPRLFQSRSAVPDGSPVEMVAWSHTQSFRHSLANPILENMDGIYFPPLSGLPMTPAVARYALMYYLSSVVRYKPSILSSNRHPDYSWLLEAFVNNAPINLITNASDGVRGKWSIFGFRVRS